MKHLTVSLVAGIALGGSLLTAIPAQASDQRPLVTTGAPHGKASESTGCVDKTEYQSAQGLMDATGGHRFDVETRWEVTGKGVYILPGLGNAVRYKRCGYALSDSFVAVAYSSTVYADAVMIGVGVYTP